MFKEENHIIFKAKAITLLDDDEAFERTSIPEWWEKSICRRILRNPYTAYYWCMHCVQHGFYNKGNMGIDLASERKHERVL